MGSDLSFLEGKQNANSLKEAILHAWERVSVKLLHSLVPSMADSSVEVDKGWPIGH